MAAAHLREESTFAEEVRLDRHMGLQHLPAAGRPIRGKAVESSGERCPCLLRDGRDPCVFRGGRAIQGAQGSTLRAENRPGPRGGGGADLAKTRFSRDPDDETLQGLFGNDGYGAGYRRGHSRFQ
jgi:hypothetical protein